MNLEELTALSQQTSQRLEQIQADKDTLARYIQDAQEQFSQLEGEEMRRWQDQQRIEAVFNRQAEIERLERERLALTARYSQIVTQITEVNAQLASVQTQMAQFATTPPTPTTTTGGRVLGTGANGVMATTYPAAFTTYQPPQLQPTFTPPPPPATFLQPPQATQLQPQPQPQQVVYEVNRSVEGFEGEVNHSETVESESQERELAPLENVPAPPQAQPQPPLPATPPVPAPAPTPPLTLPQIAFQPTANTVSKNGHHAPTVPT